jgi:hypothetical protein
MPITEEIQQTIEWFKKNLTSNDIVGKLQQAESLALNSYYLATLVADVNEQRNNLEYMYKTSLVSHQIQSKAGVSRSEIEAKEQYKALYKEYVEADNLYKRYSLLLHATENIINQVRQSNSYLKNEQRNSQM